MSIGSSQAVAVSNSAALSAYSNAVQPVSAVAGPATVAFPSGRGSQQTATVAALSTAIASTLNQVGLSGANSSTSASTVGQASATFVQTLVSAALSVSYPSATSTVADGSAASSAAGAVNPGTDPNAAATNGSTNDPLAVATDTTGTSATASVTRSILSDSSNTSPPVGSSNQRPPYVTSLADLIASLAQAVGSGSAVTDPNGADAAVTAGATDTSPVTATGNATAQLGAAFAALVSAAGSASPSSGASAPTLLSFLATLTQNLTNQIGNATAGTGSLLNARA